ncbi:phytanoyl-CoA dioxygenase domain-containing protein 1 homolog [Adelges cooleyi]|uniref:phytanoyl-CoA dioxygenase domain-containing protein 1 homolog n=1 Tax=Adelges cooleyi TaxID=133065 RepID=UPI00217FAFE6|nr:phytanoyl-CoA dioxygenase domain-containing protein 1 homolog [Adelges cooleyi]
MNYETLKSKFEKDGYVVINNFFDENDVEKLKNAGLKLTQNVPNEAKTVFKTSQNNQEISSYFMESCDKIGYFYEKDALDENGDLLVDQSIALNKVGHALHRLEPTFEAYTYNDKVSNICRALGLIRPTVVQSMYIYKNPGIGGEVVAHQDSTFLHTEPDSLVGFWIALDDSTIENGCLWVIPGTHKNDVHQKLVCDPKNKSRNQTIFQGTFPDYEQSAFVPVPVKKSGLVIIHGRIIHKSDHNKSQLSRHAYTFHVYDEASSQYSDKNWLQTKIGFKSLYL